MAGLAADSIATTLVAFSAVVAGQPSAFAVLLLATTFLGCGFGTTLSCLSTHAGNARRERRDVAVTSLNVFLGLGTALSPLLIGLFTEHGRWWFLPLAVAVALVVLLAMAVARPLSPLADDDDEGAATTDPHGVRPFLVFAVALVLYGIDETMFGNWGTTLLTDAGAGAATASYALAAFWASVTIGRVIISVVGGRLPTTTVYRCLPIAIAGYGVAAFGAGAAQRWLDLWALFRVAGGLAVVMAVGAGVIAHREDRRGKR